MRNISTNCTALQFIREIDKLLWKEIVYKQVVSRGREIVYKQPKQVAWEGK